MVDVFTFLVDHSGVSSFNQFIHELSVDSDTSSIDYSSGEYDLDGICPASPSSHGSRTSRTSTRVNHGWHWTDWMAYIFSWILLPARFLLGIPFLLFRLLNIRGSISSDPGSPRPMHFHSFRKTLTSKDHVVHCTTDRRRGVIEVSTRTYILLPLEVFCIHCLIIFCLHCLIFAIIFIFLIAFTYSL